MSRSLLAISVSSALGDFQSASALKSSFLRFESQAEPEHKLAQWLSRASGLLETTPQESVGYDASNSPLCFTQPSHGLGDRLRRVTLFASYAWATGHDLLLDWGTCGKKALFSMLFDQTSDFSVDGYGRLMPYTNSESRMMFFDDKVTRECVNAEHYHIGQIGDEMDKVPGDLYDTTQLVLWNKACSRKLLRPDVVGLVAALQRGLLPSWRTMAESTLNEAASQGYKVIGVHLRLGNGEEAFLSDERGLAETHDQMIVTIEAEAQRLATERGWGDRYRILLATDTPRIARLWKQKNPAKVVTRTDGCFVEDGHGIIEPSTHIDDDAAEQCSCVQGAAWADATALGLVDLLITPLWSELTLISKVMVLSGGGEWCADADIGAEADDFRFGTKYSCVDKNGLEQGVGFPGQYDCE